MKLKRKLIAMVMAGIMAFSTLAVSVSASYPPPGPIYQQAYLRSGYGYPDTSNPSRSPSIIDTWARFGANCEAGVIDVHVESWTGSNWIVEPNTRANPRIRLSATGTRFTHHIPEPPRTLNNYSPTHYQFQVILTVVSYSMGDGHCAGDAWIQ